MKKNNVFKTITAGLCFLSLALFAFCMLPGNDLKVQAAAGNAEQISIDAYKNGQTAPKPTADEHKGWVFAGWFEDADCETAVADKTNASGNKYAKFIPAEVVNVKCQVTANTVATTESCKLRVVTTVDSLDYQEVGFEFKIGGNASFEHKISKVFKKIVAANGNDPFELTPDYFHDSSQYFSTVTLTDIPTAGFTTGIRIIPYWVTLDGTKVYGVGRYARVEDSYLGIVNVPVRLYTDEDVAAGYLEVSYDKSIFEYYSGESVSYDVGIIFSEMKTDDTGSVIRCVGIAEDLTDSSGDISADGMYINLRFRVKSALTSGETYTFGVSEESFCDKNEISVSLDASDVAYKNINK